MSIKNNSFFNCLSFAVTSLLGFGVQASDIKAVEREGIGETYTGAYEIVIEHDQTIATHTIYRPKDFGAIKHPILVWGEGGCINAGMMFPEFLSELASHGIVVVADGPPLSMAEARANSPRPAANTAEGSTESEAPRRPPFIEPDGTDLIAALDWISEENQNKDSRFYQKLNLNKVAAMGMSCGGLMAYGASSDPRITTVGIWNSGLLQPNEEIYKKLHTSIIIVTGDDSDIAYPNGKRDFETINPQLPLLYGYAPGVGHGGTYNQDNGGIFGEVGVAWLRWQLLDDEGASGKGFFTGDNCVVCSNDKWISNSRSLN
jgi:dienelactone hydrolase